MNKQFICIKLFLIIITSWWSIVLFSNDHLFRDRAELFYVFKKVGTQDHWASVFLVSLLLYILGFVWEKIFIQKLSFFFSFFLYGTMSAGFILSKNPLSTGLGIYIGIAFLALCALRDVDDNE